MISGPKYIALRTPAYFEILTALGLRTDQYQRLPPHHIPKHCYPAICLRFRSKWVGFSFEDRFLGRAALERNARFDVVAQAKFRQAVGSSVGCFVSLVCT